MLKAHPARAALAILFMLLFLGSLGIYVRASGKASEIVGPSHLAATPDRLYVYSGKELLELSASGALRGRWPEAKLGLNYQPIDLRILSDGRLLLAQQRPAQMKACTMPDLTCELLGKDVAGKLKDQYKVFPNESTHDLLIADFDSSRIWQQPIQGGKARDLLETQALHRINDLVLDNHGRLWVADSGNHRIVALQRDADGRWSVERSLDAKNAVARPGNDWPMMLALAADGNLWVTQSNGRGQDADVLIYDPEHGAIARIDLPNGAYPTDIVRVGNTMVVSDMALFGIYRIDMVTRVVSDFGDSDLAGILHAEAARKQTYKNRMTQTIIAMSLFGMLMIGAALWATPKGQRWPRPDIAAPLKATDAVAPTITGIYWLKRHPKTDRFLALINAMLFPITLLMIVAMVYVFHTLDPLLSKATSPSDIAKIDQFKHTMMLIAITILGAPIISRFGLRNMKQSLGTDGNRLYVRLTDGRQLSFSPEQLVYGDRQILYQDRSFPIQTAKRQPLYAAGEIETYIAPLLQRAKKLSVIELVQYQFTHRESALMATLTYVLVLIGVAFATGVWRQMLP